VVIGSGGNHFGWELMNIAKRITPRSMMERLEQEGTLVAAVHMPAPGFGKIVRLEGRRYWQAL